LAAMPNRGGGFVMTGVPLGRCGCVWVGSMWRLVLVNPVHVGWWAGLVSPVRMGWEPGGMNSASAPHGPHGTAAVGSWPRLHRLRQRGLSEPASATPMPHLARGTPRSGVPASTT